MKFAPLGWFAAGLCVALSAPLAAAEPARVAALFSGSSDRVEAKYVAAAAQIGEGLAARGWTLLFGGTKTGLMGAVARGAKLQGGRVISVRPEPLEKPSGRVEAVDEEVTVQSIAERKAVFHRRAAVFLVLPGGVGTLDELSDTLEQRYLKQVTAPIIVFNQDGYYDDLLAFLDRSVREQFARASLRDHYVVVRTVDELFAALPAPAAP